MIFTEVLLRRVGGDISGIIFLVSIKPYYGYSVEAPQEALLMSTYIFLWRN